MSMQRRVAAKTIKIFMSMLENVKCKLIRCDVVFDYFLVSVSF